MICSITFENQCTCISFASCTMFESYEKTQVLNKRICIQSLTKILLKNFVARLTTLQTP